MNRPGNRFCRQAGWKNAFVRQDLRRDSGYLGMPVPANSAHERADKLEADDEDEKDDADNLAGAPLSQPAFDPGENHASKQDIEYCESDQHEGGPQEKTGLGDANPDCQSEQPQTPQRRGRVERSIHQADQEVRWKGKWKTEQI